MSLSVHIFYHIIYSKVLFWNSAKYQFMFYMTNSLLGYYTRNNFCPLPPVFHMDQLMIKRVLTFFLCQDLLFLSNVSCIVCINILIICHYFYLFFSVYNLWHTLKKYFVLDIIPQFKCYKHFSAASVRVLDSEQSKMSKLTIQKDVA